MQKKTCVVCCTPLISLLSPTWAQPQQAVVLPPLIVSIDAEFEPTTADPTQWILDYTGWRAESPASSVEYYGFSGPSGPDGWESAALPAWSDDPTAIDPAYDPHLERTLQVPEVWDMLEFANTQSFGYEVQEIGLGMLWCIDEGCGETLPGGIQYDDSGAAFVMPEVHLKATAKTKRMRPANPAYGPGADVLVQTLRSDGLSDTQIDMQYPGLLLEPAEIYTPTTSLNAFIDPVIYTIFDDQGLVLATDQIVPFLESKNMPGQMIHEIVNGLPLSNPGAIGLTTGGGGDEWEDVEIEVEFTGGIEAETGFPNNSVTGSVSFRVKINGTAGQIVNGSEDMIAAVTSTVETAVSAAQQTIEDAANGVDDDEDDEDDVDVDGSVKLVVGIARVTAWLSQYF